MKRDAAAVLLFVLVSAAGCGHGDQSNPSPPTVLDVTLEWSTYRVAGFEGEPPRPRMKALRHWRAEFKPDHTFRYAWQESATAADAWNEIRGTWRVPADEPWAAHREHIWILVPESAPKSHEPSFIGRDVPILWWTPGSGPPGGPYRPTWWFSNVDPVAGCFTNSMNFVPDARP